MDDFQKRFPRTVAMVESRIASQDTVESARHIHQQPQPKEKVMWQDVTSYSQSDKKRLPNCWSVKIGNFELSLVWNHRYCPDTWSTSLYGVYENHDLKLSSYDDLKLAQRKALLLAEKVFGDVLAAVKKEAATTSPNT